MFNNYKHTIDKLLLQLFRPTVTIKRTVNMPITYALLAGECTSLGICTCLQSYPLLIQYAAVQYACTVNTAAKVHSVRINTAHMNYFFVCVYCTHIISCSCILYIKFTISNNTHVHTSGVGCSSVCSTWEMC